MDPFPKVGFKPGSKDTAADSGADQRTQGRSEGQIEGRRGRFRGVSNKGTGRTKTLPWLDTETGDPIPAALAELLLAFVR